jgi:2-hydroxychromene-2-carboxylate isomerase
VITFWFDFASTYSYIGAERMRALGAVPPAVSWRPFLLGPIFKEFGLTTSPFVTWPVKGAYMWRDLERLADRHGLAFRKPDPFPQHSVLAGRVATAHATAPWLPDFACGVFRAEFAEGRDIADPATLAAVLEDVGVDAAGALAAARTDDAKAALRAATDAAAARGLFGAPSFTVGDELFWGQDRLDDALAWGGFAPSG